MHRRIGTGNGLHGLAGNLSQTFAGNQRFTALSPGNPLGGPHHKPAHDDGEQFFRAFFQNLLLNMGKGNGNHLHPSAVLADFFQQAHNFFLGALAGIGRAGKVNGRQLHAPLGNAPRRHRAVNAATDEDGRFSAGSHRNTAGAGTGVAVNISAKVPDLHPHFHVRVVDVNGKMGELLQQIRTHLSGNLRRRIGEFLVGPLALHLKGRGLHQFVPQIVGCGLLNGGHVLFRHTGAGIGHNAEHLSHLFLGGVQIGLFVFGNHINGGLGGFYLKFSQTHETAADIFQQLGFKDFPVQSLEHQLSQFNQNCFLHIPVFLSLSHGPVFMEKSP